MPNAAAGIEQTANGGHPVNVFTENQAYGNFGPQGGRGARQDNFDATKYVSGPLGASKDSANGAMDTQLNGYAFLKKTIIDLYKYRTFQNIATTREQPKFSGTTMKMYRYLPIIDARNLNDQGINAQGITVTNGNLYGGARNPGDIEANFPWGREGGGRINRVGFTRKQISSDLKKVQFFWEGTEDMLNFDSDASFYKHCVELSGEAMNKITEDFLQIQLQNNAGVTIFGGTKTAKADLDDTSVVDYNLFAKLNLLCTKNKIPSTTKMIKGSGKTDTRVIPNARVLYVPSELLPDLERAVDYHGKQAFRPVESYAAAGKVLENEVGAIGKFRIIEVEEMVTAGVAGAGGAGMYVDAAGNLQVFNMILAGADSFNAVTMHSMGGANKKFGWRVIAKKPGVEMADRHDPYGENYFWSTRMYLGFLALRPERLINIQVTAKM